MKIESEFCEYLKNDDFLEFMKLWRKQFERYGRVGGTISVVLSESNRECISGLLGVDYRKQSHAKIKYSQFKKAIEESRFADCDFNEVLHLYFSDEIITQKTVKERKENYQNEMFEEVLVAYVSTKAHQWLSSLYLSKGSVYIRLCQEIKNNRMNCRKQLIWVMEAINQLPLWVNESENISVFSSKITGDPHAFDKKQLPYYLLFNAICYLLHLANDNYLGIEQHIPMFQAGLYRESTSNFCCLARLRAFDKNKEVHEGWQGFYKRFETFNVNVENVLNISEIDKNCCLNVCIVENPSLYQKLVAHAKLNDFQNLAFVCTYGQLNFCAYLLLDKLKEADIKMYYSGDMDPEGLLIADKLKLKYKNQLVLWRYSINDYFKCASQNFVNKTRLKMLKHLQSAELIEIANAMQEGCVGYQENLINDYIEDLQLLNTNSLH